MKFFDASVSIIWFGTVAANCRLRAAPKNVTCNLAGKVPPFENFPGYFDEQPQPQIFNTVEECARMCAGRIWSPKIYGLPRSTNVASESFCHSFRYNAETKLCSLGGYGLAKSNVKPKEGSLDRFWDIDCFNCGDDLCEQQFGKNILDNGDFEQNQFGPWYVQGAKLGDSKGPIGAFTNYRPGEINRFYQRPYASQLVNECGPDTYYAFSFDYKVYAGNDTPHIYFTGLNTNGIFRLYGNYTEKKQDSYHKLRGIGTGLNGNIDFECAPKVSKFYLDNIQIVRIKPSAIKLPGSNSKSIIPNGDFETGELAPWNAFNNTSTGSTAVVGSPGTNGSAYALLLTDVEYHTSASVYQNFAVTPFTFYYFSLTTNAKLAANSTEPQGAKLCYIYAYMRKISDSYSYFQYMTSFPIENPEEQEHGTHVYATNDQLNVTLSAVCDYQSNLKFDITIDNIQLRQVSSAPFANIQ